MKIIDLEYMILIITVFYFNSKYYLVKVECKILRLLLDSLTGSDGIFPGPNIFLPVRSVGPALFGNVWYHRTLVYLYKFVLKEESDVDFIIEK
jgi:hypothetical protein